MAYEVRFQVSGALDNRLALRGRHESLEDALNDYYDMLKGIKAVGWEAEYEFVLLYDVGNKKPFKRDDILMRQFKGCDILRRAFFVPLETGGRKMVLYTGKDMDHDKTEV